MPKKKSKLQLAQDQAVAAINKTNEKKQEQNTIRRIKGNRAELEASGRKNNEGL